MAKKLYLKNLLGELSLDRALLQILDQPYLKDLASRLKETEAVQEIFKKLQKEESIMDWMDYDQLMNLREVTLPQMLIKESGLEEPGSLPGEIGTTFDEQFEDILGPLPKNARGGIAALQEGGEFGDVVEWITGDFKEKKYTRDWNKLTKEQQEIWKEAMRKKHGKDYKGDYIPFRNYSYWNPETEGYQDLPVTEEQWANEPHILKQRREHKEVTPYGYDSPKAWKEVLKQLGLDEGEWWKAYGEGNIPGVHGPVGGFWHTLTAPMDAYERNAEEWSAQTGRPVKFLNEMGGGLGVGLPVGYAGSYGIGALIRKFGSAKVAQMMAEAFPLTMSKKGLLSLSNWKKSLWRNPKELMKLHWTNWSKGIPGQILKKLAPSAAAKFGAGSLAGPAGWTAAAGLTAWDAYRIYKWLQEGQQEKKEIEALAE